VAAFSAVTLPAGAKLYGSRESSARRLLPGCRHLIRIMFMDPIGQLTVVSPQTDSVAHSAEAPRWFAALVRPQVVGRAVRVVAIDHASPVIIIGEPSDEIAEAWRDFSSLAIIWLTLNDKLP
jgi:two-component system, NarL family, sensor histidine kinase UhpB